jgi:hypothetical protein
MSQETLRLPLRECISSGWYTSPSDHRCPHDAWIEAVNVCEPASGERQERRLLEIRIRLLGAYHDGIIEFMYKGIDEYSLQASMAPNGHGDWLRDEVDDCGVSILHTIVLANGRLQIKAAEVEYKWTPLPIADHPQADLQASTSVQFRDDQGAETMTYLKVKWHHTKPDEPAILYSELDENRWEMKKVEVYSDGSCGYAGEGEECGGTRLGLTAVPPPEEIAANPEFELMDTSKSEFEAVWKDRKKHLMRGEEKK